MATLLWKPHSRWTVLVASCWIEATAGITYVFGTYSSLLKSNLGYDQSHINQLAVAKDLGDSVGIAAGLLSMVIPYWATLLVGAVLISLGYGSMWLLAAQKIPSLPFWMVCIIMFIGTNGCTYLDTAALVICLGNFPDNRGTVVGLLKGFKGLCGAIYSQVYTSLISPDELSFILLLALGPVATVLPLIFILGPPSVKTIPDKHTENIVFRCLYGSAALLATYMFCVTLTQDLTTVSDTINIVFTVFLFIILVMPLPITKTEQYIANLLNINDSESNQQSKVTDPLLVKIDLSSSAEIAPSKPYLGSNYTILKAFSSLDFWLLFSAVLFSMGSGTTVINNLSQIGEAQGYTNTDVFVSMINIWSFVGRLVAGYVSETLARAFGYPRTLTLAVSQFVMAIGHVMLAMAWPGTIYLSIFLVGTTYGCHWAMFPTILSELFGLQNFNILYNFLTMTAPAGSLVYSGCIAGPIYDWQAVKQGSTTSECTGVVCFQLTFFILAGVCILGMMMSLVLSLRTWSLYVSTFKGSHPRLH